MCKPTLIENDAKLTSTLDSNVVTDFPAYQTPSQATNPSRNSELTFRFRGYHCNCLFCLLSQSHVSKSSSTSPRKLLRLKVSRCQTDRFSFWVFKTCFSILYCISEKNINMINSITLCQSYDTEMMTKTYLVDQSFLPVRSQLSEML